MNSVLEKHSEEHVMTVLGEICYEYKDWEELGSSDIYLICKEAARALDLVWEEMSESAHLELRYLVNGALSKFFC